MILKTFDFKAPTGWTELTDEQLWDVYEVLAADMTLDEIKVRCLLRWNGLEVLNSKQGTYVLGRKKGTWEGYDFFITTPEDIAAIARPLDWLGEFSATPVRPAEVHAYCCEWAKALPADFDGVPFETYLAAENLFQGYLATQCNSLLDDLARLLYPAEKLIPTPELRVAVFYWMASLKGWLSRKYPDLFQPVPTEPANLLGNEQPSAEDAMNAQIRALTKGDITKETTILAMDCHRALVELNAQAREYQELNSKMKS